MEPEKSLINDTFLFVVYRSIPISQFYRLNVKIDSQSDRVSKEKIKNQDNEVKGR